MPQVHRVTLFKVPDAANQQKLIDSYNELKTTQSKDGKPYILYLSAGRAVEDDRSKGYTVVVKLVFESLADQKYYDEEDAGHASLKKTAAGLGLPELPLSVYYEGTPIIGN